MTHRTFNTILIVHIYLKILFHIIPNVLFNSFDLCWCVGLVSSACLLLFVTDGQ